MRRIHHVGIVVNRLQDAYRFYRDTLGLPLIKEATISDQHVRAALLGAGESEIELLEPLDSTSGIGRFLARRGEGLHHLCFDTPDIVKTLTSLKEMRRRAARRGAAGRTRRPDRVRPPEGVLRRPRRAGHAVGDHG